MKKIFLVLILLLFLSSCNVKFGQNYAHLQEQDPTLFHEVDIAGDINKNIIAQEKNLDEEKGVFDSLNDNLCNLKPECCNKLSDEQKDFRDLEKRAVVETNKELCSQLPDEAFIISCGNDLNEDVVLYSKQRCFDSFTR